MRQDKRFFILKVYKGGKLIQEYATHYTRRFWLRIKAVKFLDSTIEAYIKVKYGYSLNNFNKRVMFYNDGTYNSPKDLIQAAKAFMEEPAIL